MTTVKLNGRTIGEVIASVFIKHVQGSKHFMRTPPGIAFDTETLEMAKTMGAQYVVVVDGETQKQYCARITTIEQKGLRIDHGYGPQICLQFVHFQPSLEALRAEQSPML